MDQCGGLDGEFFLASCSSSVPTAGASWGRPGIPVAGQSVRYCDHAPSLHSYSRRPPLGAAALAAVGWGRSSPLLGQSASVESIRVFIRPPLEGERPACLLTVREIDVRRVGDCVPLESGSIPGICRPVELSIECGHGIPCLQAASFFCLLGQFSQLGEVEDFNVHALAFPDGWASIGRTEIPAGC